MRDEARIREFMRLTFVDKRWYRESRDHETNREADSKPDSVQDARKLKKKGSVRFLYFHQLYIFK